MTAPLLTLPISAPAASGGGQPVPGAAGAMGFEALLAAFFATSEGEAGASLLGEGEKADETTDAETVASDGAPANPVDAQTLAALLAVTPQAAATPVAAETAEAPVSQGGAPSAAFSPLLAQEIASPTAPPTAAPSADAAAQAKTAPVEPAAIERPDTVLGATPATEDGLEKPLAPGLEKPREAQVTPAAEHAQAKGAPPAHAAAAQAAPPPPAAPAPQTAADPLVQAEAAATAVEPPTEPVEEPAKPAKSDSARRTGASANQATAPAAPTDDPAALIPAVAANADASGEPTVAVEGEAVAAAAPREAKPQTADAPDAQGPGGTSAVAHNAAGAVADAPLPARGSPETVAHLAAQIVKKLEGRSTRFDVQLNPAGLGQVNVAIEIGAHGKMTAALQFESAQAANELRGRATELHKALEQAGFDLSSGGLSFDVAGDRGQGRGDLYQQQQQQQNEGAWRGRAFQAVLDTADGAAEAAAAAALQLQRRPTTGVDVRV